MSSQDSIFKPVAAMQQPSSIPIPKGRGFTKEQRKWGVVVGTILVPLSVAAQGIPLTWTWERKAQQTPTWQLTRIQPDQEATRA